MQIFIKVKQAGKRRLVLEKQPIEIADIGSEPTLKTLIVAIATQQIMEYNAKIIEKPVAAFLTQPEIDYSAHVGKVRFGTIYNTEKVDLQKSLHEVLIAFVDGNYVVSVDDKIIEKLENTMEITQNSVVTFIRLTALIGA